MAIAERSFHCTASPPFFNRCRLPASFMFTQLFLDLFECKKTDFVCRFMLAARKFTIQVLNRINRPMLFGGANYAELKREPQNLISDRGNCSANNSVQP
ncbi:hypothetical protein QR680_011907 [Steinernema hermaphroditum]|uniref:Uncharacterized protein n=1 Tax=Steinernema hermaphroditum TaxID=289476 RepID=A0AA39LYV9_9BILA|nr:hypothetical protein QR680_011907 [Steinernema hermaphroditum]